MEDYTFRPAELPPLPARYPSHDVFRNQSDSRISYESPSISSPSPAAPPPPLPPKPAMPPPLPDRTNSVSPRAPVLPPKIKLEEQKAVELGRDIASGSRHFLSNALVLATTESGEPLRTLYVPTGIQEQFLRIARINTDKNIETCGILCGSLVNEGYRFWKDIKCINLWIVRKITLLRLPLLLFQNNQAPRIHVPPKMRKRCLSTKIPMTC